MTNTVSPSTPFGALLAAASLSLPPSIDGTELWPVFKADGSLNFYKMTGAALAAINTKASSITNTLTNTTGVTLTAAQLQPGGAQDVYTKMTGTLAAGAALTLPTVAALVAALGSSFVAGMSWKMRLQNESSGAFAWTLTTAAGWGSITNGAVAQNTWRDFVFTLTSATAGTVVDVGSGVSP